MLRNLASGLLQIGRKLKHSNDATIFRHNVIVFKFILFLLSSLVTCPSFISISSLVLELWSFLFIRDWPEIRKSEILSSKFCAISGDWGKLGTPDLAQSFLIKCYWILQNPRVTPSWFSLNTSQTVQAIILAFCSIQ